LSRGVRRSLNESEIGDGTSGSLSQYEACVDSVRMCQGIGRGTGHSERDRTIWRWRRT